MLKHILYIPLGLFKFWYIESLYFFLRLWKNIILYLEEDLAVNLMFKLLFTPLFHDTTIVGKALSFIFRVSRILIGVFAFLVATVIVFLLLGFWLSTPVLSIFGFNLGFVQTTSQLLAFSGTGFFLINKFFYPHKEVMKKTSIDFKKLLEDREVLSLLSLLEMEPNSNFADVKIGQDKDIFEEAFNLAKKAGSKYIGKNYLFVACLKTIPQIENFLLKFNLQISDFEEALNYQEKKKNLWRKVWIWDSDFTVRHLKGVNRGWLGVPTPYLDSVSSDLTHQAAKIGFEQFLGRGAVLTELINVLSQDIRNNVVIVGQPGCGKTALIQYLAKQILAGDAPPAMATKRVVLLDTTKLLSGMRTQGDLADRIKQIFEEISFAQNVILVIEEIHNLGIGEAGVNMNLYSLMLPYIESSSFQFIVTTEQENYAKILEKQGAFARLFTKIELPPASEAESRDILEQRAILYEREKKVKVSYLAIKKTVELSAKLIKDRVLPDSALAILREAQTEEKGNWVTQEVINRVVSMRVNVPVLELGNVAKEKLLNLEKEIHQKLIDQEEAVEALASSLRRSATGLREKNRPIGSFLFVGPTGVGKTELAKTLAEVYFKGSDAFLSFDMSEYQASDSINRLIGVSGEGGQLTEAVRNKQYALLLLDEFEKADPKILTLFLQVLEDGRLTDGAGRVVDFTNTIIIATSNAASLTIAQGLEKGKTLAELDLQVNEELLQIFRPELINRFDDVILFKTLAQDDLLKIVRLKLSALQKQLKEQGYLVEFDEAIILQLSEKGFSPVLGARPLRRLIQDTLEANLSKLILQSKLTKGQTFKIGVELLG